MWLCLWREDVHPRVDQEAARDWNKRVSDLQRPRRRDTDESAKRLPCKHETLMPRTHVKYSPALWHVPVLGSRRAEPWPGWMTSLIHW